MCKERKANEKLEIGDWIKITKKQAQKVKKYVISGELETEIFTKAVELYCCGKISKKRLNKISRKNREGRFDLWDQISKMYPELFEREKSNNIYSYNLYTRKIIRMAGKNGNDEQD